MNKCILCEVVELDWKVAVACDECNEFVESLKKNKTKRRSKLEIIKSVVENQQATKIRMVLGTGKSRTILLDYQTANLLLKVLNEAPPENLAKLQQLPWDRLCNLAWSLAKRSA